MISQKLLTATGRGWTATLLTLFAAAALSAPVGAQEAAPKVVVRGESEVEVAPDIAQLQLGVQAQAEEASDAQRLVSEAARRVLDALAEEGVAERDVRTSGINLYPVYDHRPRPQEEQEGPRVVGYQASNSVSVRLNDLAKVGTVIDRAIAAGATNVDSLQLTVRDESAARQEALRGAVADAAGKASAIAAALGSELGAVIEVQEGGASVTPMFLEAGASMLRSQAAVTTPVAAGTVTVRAQVTVAYRLR
jgi:hypothetical protein